MPSRQGAVAKRNAAEVIIVGGGFSGICMGIRLKQAGMHDFVILERNEHLGGTWWDNVYPGAACDVESHLYSYSFAPNPGWSRMFSPQQEILQYLERCANAHGLGDHFRFSSPVTGARFDESAGSWNVRTGAGAVYTSPLLISATGPLSQPSIPDIKGLRDFKGPVFHSARWDRGFDPSGKTVAVIGTGASAIQIVPSLAPLARGLHLFQRTPPWVIEKPDKPLPAWRQGLYRRFPLAQQLHRGRLYWMREMLALPFVVDPRVAKLFEKKARRFLEKSVRDPVLRCKLTPAYTMGCKRVLLSNDYYPALQRENVEVVTTGIDGINPTGVLTADGRQRDVDAIILATGFKAADGALPFEVRGRNGVDLQESWRDGAEAYLGSSVAGFPNLFLLIGPNTGLGHSSMLLMIEAQVQYTLGGIHAVRRQRAKFIDVRPEVQEAYNRKIQEKLAKTVWQTGGCRSWYQNAGGKNVTLWPGFTFTFMRRTRNFDPRKYEIVKAADSPSAPAAATL